MRSSLIHQIFIFILVPVVCVVGFTYFQVHSLLHHLKTHLESDLENTLTLVERELQLIADTTNQLVDMISRSESVVRAYKNRQADFLFRWGSRLVVSKLVDRVIFIDHDGVVLTRGHDEYLFNDTLSDNPFFFQAKSGETFSGIAKFEGNLSLITVKPMMEYGSIFHGAVVVTKNIVPDVLDRLEAGLDISLMIHPEPNDPSPSSEKAEGVFQISKKLGFPTLAAPPYFITITKDYKKELDRYRMIRFGIILVTISVTCIAMFFVYISVRYLLKPIRTLHRWLEAYNNGDMATERLSHEFEAFRNRKNELGLIAKEAFSTLQELESTRSQLASSNKASIQSKEKALKANRELQHLSQNLEKLVAERTRELSSKSDLLEKEVVDRQLAEQESRALKNRLQGIFDAMPSVLIGIDASGHVIHWNKAAQDVSSVTDQKAIGIDLESALRFFGVADNPLPDDITARPRRQSVKLNGKKRYYDISTYSFASDTNAGKVIRIDDVTTHVLLEQELFKTEKLKAIGVLAGGIAHDFNNLLLSILGNINLAMVGGDLDGKVTSYLKSAETSCIQAKSLTQQLLTFSKGGDPVREEAGLGEILKEAAQFAITGFNSVCRFSIPSDLWSAHIDKAQIGQVIQNLVLNASQAMLEGGEINLSCNNLRSEEDRRIDHLKPGAYIRIAISDNGPGIPSKLIEKVFDPYFTTREDGNGLGLAICYSIMKKHDGHIAIASTIGEGTTFFLYLPAYETFENVKTEQLSPIAQNRGVRKILVMDDEEIIRKTMGAMLEKLGHRVEFAEDGETSISRYQKEFDSGTPFDIVFMDLVVKHGMGGKEAVKRILQIDPKANVVVSSGYSNDPIIANFDKFGFTTAIAKPFTLKDLASTIEKITRLY